MKNRKGISTFIATLLLMVLAVAAGIVIYAYTMGYLGGVGNPNTMGALSIDSMGVDATTGTATIYIRNIGKVPLTLSKVYIDGKDSTGTPQDIQFSPSPLNENIVGTITIQKAKFTAAMSPQTGSKTFEIKLICADNTQLTFNIKATG